MSTWQVVTARQPGDRGPMLLPAVGDVGQARERQTLEIDDNIVQGLARVKWALEARQEEEALRAADRRSARRSGW